MNTVRKKILQLILLASVMQIIFCSNTLGQREKIDSLEQILTTAHSTNRIDILNNISALFIPSNDPLRHIDRLMNKPASDSVHYYSEEALNESFKVDYVKGIADAYYNSALIECINIFDLRAIEKNARCAEVYLEQLNDENKLTSTFEMLGLALWGQSEFDEAIKSFQEEAAIFESNKDSVALSKTYNFIAGVYIDWGYNAKSFEYTSKAMQLNVHDFWTLDNLAALYFAVEDYQTSLSYLHRVSRLNTSDKSNIPGDYYVYIQTFSAMKQYDSALYYCQKWTEAISVNAVDSESRRISLRWPEGYIGDIYLLQKKYDLALQKLNSALLLFEQSNDVNLIMWHLLSLARCYAEMGNTQLALQSTNRLLDYANRTGARQFIRDGSQLLWSIHSQLGRNDSAYFYLRKYTAIKDTLAADQSIQKLAFYKSFAAIEKQQDQIESLKKEREIQQARLQNEYILKYIFIGGIIFGLLLTAIVFRNITLKRRNESNRRELVENELDIQKLEAQKQMSDLEMQALRAQMNPHFIFNSLNSINRFILQNDKAQASEYLTKFSKLVRLILQNSQAALISLESELESLDLYLELEALRFDHRFEYKISFPKDLDFDTIKVPPLIIQPYAENAIWHGLMNKEEKGHLHIQISHEENHLMLKIIDDGIGRKAASELESKSSNKHKSVGLKITAERIAVMQNLNGKQSAVVINDLVNSDGTAAGTEVIVKLPLIQ